jgi:hypothetical protein
MHVGGFILKLPAWWASASEGASEGARVEVHGGQREKESAAAATAGVIGDSIPGVQGWVRDRICECEWGIAICQSLRGRRLRLHPVDRCGRCWECMQGLLGGLQEVV